MTDRDTDEDDRHLFVASSDTERKRAEYLFDNGSEGRIDGYPTTTAFLEQFFGRDPTNFQRANNDQRL